ncbi:asparagine synthase-related protein [Rhizobium sullae]|uniref:Asparagine synthase n=1 Tax=Rhizobium sullae TaxID=50338 RepID=A0A4R3Q9V4_RHISU|nr:asparagine synthase-related protein [Rhizobium sullae]TCU18198.1 asparagine synthase [Rhizobium sullae]
MVANFALNIRGSRDVREETRSILEHLVGDGILIVSTSHHSTLLVPAFSEFSIFAWRDGSEIILFDAYESFRAFLDEQGISAGINRNRISQFLASDRIHNNQSTFSGLVEVEHGSSVTSLSGEPITSLIELNHLPDLVCNAVDTSLSYSDASETVRSLVFEAVKAKASPSDVGISTSGGFDSSLLGLLYGREFPDKVPHLYHVYSSAIHGFNEIDYFNDVRQRLEHRVTWLDTENTRDRRLDFPHMVPAFRPPLVSGWYERNWMLYAAAKADGVKTLLSGDGGDQLIAVPR